MCVKCFESEGKLPCDAYQGIVHWAWWSLKDQKPDSSLASETRGFLLKAQSKRTQVFRVSSMCQRFPVCSSSTIELS